MRASLASVKNTTARYEASAWAGPARSPLPERKIVAAQKLQQRDPLEAIGKYLSAAEAAANRLREQPKDAAALRDYNFALARVFSPFAPVRLMRGRSHYQSRVMS